MSHFQLCKQRLLPAGVLAAHGALAVLGLTALAAAPIHAQQVQRFEPQPGRATVAPAAPSTSSVSPLTAAQSAAQEVDYGLLNAAYNGETYNVRNWLAKGANIEVRGGEYGFTPLMYAASNGHLGTVRYLISKGAKVNARSNQGVIVPVVKGKTMHSERFEQQGQIGQMNLFPILLGENGGLTPLHLACAGGYNLTVRELLAKGANVNARTSDGDTPLMYASFKGYLPSVQTLLARGAQVNATEVHNTTALDLAAWQGHLPIVRALLARGAKINVRRDNGWTSVTFAQAGGNTTIVRLLRQVAERQAKREGGLRPVNATKTPATTPTITHVSPVPSAGNIKDGSIIVVR